MHMSTYTYEEIIKVHYLIDTKYVCSIKNVIWKYIHYKASKYIYFKASKLFQFPFQTVFRSLRYWDFGKERQDLFTNAITEITELQY